MLGLYFIFDIVKGDVGYSGLKILLLLLLLLLCYNDEKLLLISQFIRD
jgi:hypothetical protein